MGKLRRLRWSSADDNTEEGARARAGRVKKGSTRKPDVRRNMQRVKAAVDR